MKFIFSISIILFLTSCQMIQSPVSWVQQESISTTKHNTEISTTSNTRYVQPILYDSILVTTSNKKIIFTNIFTRETINIIKSKTDGYVVGHEGNGYVIPTILNKNTIYHIDNKGTLIALNSKTGKLKWTNNDIGRWVVKPIFENETIYIASSYGLICLSEKTGEEKWSIRYTDKIRNYGEVVIIGNNADNIIAYDKNELFSVSKVNGKINWMKETNVYSAIPYQSNIIYTTSKKIIYLDIITGEEVSSISSKSKLRLSKYNNEIFAISDNGSVFSINKTQIEKLYTGSLIRCEPINIYENILVIEGYTKFGYVKLFAFNLEKIKLIWNNELSLPIPIKPIYRNRHLYITTQYGIVKLNIFDGEIISTYNNENINNGESIDVDGLIFMRLFEDNLYISKQ